MVEYAQVSAAGFAMPGAGAAEQFQVVVVQQGGLLCRRAALRHALDRAGQHHVAVLVGVAGLQREGLLRGGAQRAFMQPHDPRRIAQ
ncbi:hypothetical protein D3C81_1977870 [compost metagenome]